MNKFRTKKRNSSLIHGISGYSSNKLAISWRQSVFLTVLGTFVSSRLFYVSLSNFLFLYCDQTPVANQSKFFWRRCLVACCRQKQTSSALTFFNRLVKLKMQKQNFIVQTAKKMLRSMIFPINQTWNQSIFFSKNENWLR